jgi:hypothetical protein
MMTLSRRKILDQEVMGVDTDLNSAIHHHEVSVQEITSYDNQYVHLESNNGLTSTYIVE